MSAPDEAAMSRIAQQVGELLSESEREGAPALGAPLAIWDLADTRSAAPDGLATHSGSFLHAVYVEGDAALTATSRRDGGDWDVAELSEHDLAGRIAQGFAAADAAGCTYAEARLLRSPHHLLHALWLAGPSGHHFVVLSAPRACLGSRCGELMTWSAFRDALLECDPVSGIYMHD